ncbi:MAG: winged helix-turn-helix domain-containing protein [Bradyrhizobium sp.]|uniref:winged helix-turn-helix domain-containing tetratricopeptide repeat protein n=1 Tax=Bradyrhizobium sp. TaxID=376 RepID=UPI001D938EF4|nr:winged helix-turn-helix domain-containing protein [Bradyrhizobium sp.]MBV9559095.1 winged helix-turn-helix domain-containing protein [Bradyrhizobium sp.]
MIFRFGDYTLDVVQGCLKAADREVDLRPKSFEVLRCLVENVGRLVTKDELIKTVWPSTIVTDESLARCISEVRQAIGDADQTIIKTLPRRGYRFSSAVFQHPENIGPGAVVASPLADSSAGSKPRITDRASIAVLPFANLSGDPQQEYFSDGITEDIITELSRFSELAVIARNSTFQYKGKALDIRDVGRQLGVSYVLEGSIRRAGDRMRISAQLIDAASGAHLWAERYDREVSDVFVVQDEVTRAIVTVLSGYVKMAEAERTLLKPPAAWEAYDYYLQGTRAYWLGFTESSVASTYEARRFLEKSLSIDPNYARAYAILARSYVATYLEPRDGDYLLAAGLERAHEFARKAVQLDGGLPEAHAQFGWVLLFQRRHEAAIAEYERAISLNPNFTDTSFGLCLMFAGEPERARDILQANVRLDPFQNASRLGYIGHAHYMLNSYPEAIPPLRECAWRMPNFRIVKLWLASAYAQAGHFAEAQAAADEVRRIEPRFTIDRWKTTAVYKNQTDAEHLFDGLRKAGLSEC